MKKKILPLKILKKWKKLFLPIFEKYFIKLIQTRHHIIFTRILTTTLIHQIGLNRSHKTNKFQKSTWLRWLRWLFTLNRIHLKQLHQLDP